jgi:hypothetical protein
MLRVPILTYAFAGKVLLTSGLCLAVCGCAQFGDFSTPTSSIGASPTAQTDILAPGPATASTARPAVLVDETTATGSGAPVTLTPPKPVTTAVNSAPEQLPPAGYAEANKADAKTRLLTPEEKAKVIAELEALAKSQSASLAKSKKNAECAQDPAKPAGDATGATDTSKC